MQYRRIQGGGKMVVKQLTWNLYFPVSRQGKSPTLVKWQLLLQLAGGW